MSLPLMHSFVGYSVYRFSKKEEEVRNWKMAFYCMFLANLPDIDFLPGLLIGKAAKFHHTITHSFGAAFFCGLIFASLYYLWKNRNPLKFFFITFASYSSHIILDMFNHSWKGMPIFWPFTFQVFAHEETLVPIEKMDPLENDGWNAFAGHVLSVPCLHRLLIEIAVVMAVMAALSFYQDFKKRSLADTPALVLKKQSI